MTPERELDLERTVVDAWPALASVDLDGWLLRSSGGPTHRGNSAATLAASSALPLDARIELTEAWYRAREQPVMVQIGPCSVPRGLDAALAARGYTKEGAAWVVTAPASTVARRSAPGAEAQRAPRGEGSFHAVLEPSPTPEWLGIAAGASRFAASPDVFSGFLARLEGRCRFITVRDGRAVPAATCLCIQSPARAGIYAMFTLPSYRRRGAGRALLHAAATAAIAAGQSELYLLVEEGNAAARALYASAGFEDVYPYHYRVLREARGAFSG